MIRPPLRQPPFPPVVPHDGDVPRLLCHHRVDEIHGRVAEPQKVRPPPQVLLNLLDPRLDLLVQRRDLRVAPECLHEVMRRLIPARHVHEEIVTVRVRRVLTPPGPHHVVELDGRTGVQTPRTHDLAQVHELGTFLLPEQRLEPVVQVNLRGVLLVQ